MIRIGLLLILTSSFTCSLRAETVVVWWRGDFKNNRIVNSAESGRDYDLTKNSWAISSKNVSSPEIFDGLSSEKVDNTASYENSAENAGGNAPGSELSPKASFSLTEILKESSFTIEAIVLLDSAGMNYQNICSGGNVSFGTDGNGALRFSARDGSGAARTAQGPRLDLNRWYHIAAVGSRNESDGDVTVQLYVDGEPVDGGDALFANAIVFEEEPVFAISNKNAVYGFIDEVRISKQALTAKQFLRSGE